MKTTLASIIALIALTASPAHAQQRALANALPAGHASCHAKVLDAAERADPNRRIVSMALERTANDVATERKWSKLEEFDGTPLVSATLRVRLRADAARLRISVCDQGAGIPEAFWPRVFEKFSQADASDSRDKAGTGLGLAITRRLVERMHGQISFESAPGRGTCFHVDLPRAEG